jgi:hypothetical protein
MRPFSLLLPLAALTLQTAPCAAEHLFVSSVVADSVYRYDIPPMGPPVLEAVLTDSLDRPAYLALDPAGDLFVVNRGAASGGSGSIAQFGSPLATPTLVQVIADVDTVPAFDFDQPHGILFRGPEMFLVNSWKNRVQRFLFDAMGNPVPNGTIAAGLCCTDARGIAISPFTGELFVTEANLGSLQLSRYAFDAAGNAALQQSFSSPGSNDHGMAFAPWGEMFVTEANTNTVARFLFDGTAPVQNGQISGNGLLTPVDVAFSAAGEMFVTNTGAPRISRWTFDGSGNVADSSEIVTPTPVAGLVFAGDATPVAADLSPEPAPGAVMLRVSPNPGRGVFSFTIDLPDPDRASLTVYDIAGRRVGGVDLGELPAGRTRTVWAARGADGALLPAGVYFGRLETAGTVRTVKIVNGSR